MCLKTDIDKIVMLYYNDCTYYNNVQSIINELLQCFKSKSIKNFKQKDIEKYFKFLKDKQNSNSTINTKLVFLNKILKYNNVILKIPFQKVRNKEKQIISNTKFQYLLDEFQNNKQMFNFCMIAYYTGLRANEILNIQKQHLIYDNGYYLNLYNTKNHKDNFIPLSDKLTNILNEFTPFTINYKQVYYNFSKYGISAHQFRHTFITKCYEKGLDSLSIMKLTNQTSLSVHQRYNHISNKHLQDLIKVL